MSQNFELVESFILDRISKTRIPGLSIALVKDGEVIYSKGFGFRDVDSGLPATPNTIYGIGSVTKSFTALAIMQLYEEGRLDLEDPIEKHLPLNLKPKGSSIKIHNLLTHTTGLPALAYAEAFIMGVLELGESWLPISKPEDIIPFMRGSEDWAVSKPGERFFYLNEGYVLLGLIISKVSGLRYEDYVEKKILEPLGMGRTYFFKEDVEKDPDRATPYTISGEGKVAPSKFPYGITSDGGLLSNVIDLSKYIAMYLGRGALGDVRLVSSKSIELMEKPYVKVPYEIFGGEAYGYGLEVHPNFLGYKLVDHGGSVLVYTAYIGYVPERRIGVAVLANASGYPLSNIGMYALASLLGRDPERELPFIKRENVYRKLEGIYETYKSTMKLGVKAGGDFLYIEHKYRYIEERIPIIPEVIEEDYAKFYTFFNGMRIPVEFHITNGKVEMLYERYKLVKKS